MANSGNGFTSVFLDQNWTGGGPKYRWRYAWVYNAATDELELTLALQGYSTSYGGSVTIGMQFRSTGKPWVIVKCNDETVWSELNSVSGRHTVSGWQDIYAKTATINGTGGQASIIITNYGQSVMNGTALRTSDSTNEIEVDADRYSMISGPATGPFGTALSYSVAKYIPESTVVVTAECAGHTETLYSGAGTSVTWTPAIATYAPLIPSAVSAVATVTAETFLNGVSIGSSNTSTELSLPASVRPTISSVTPSDPEGFYTAYGAYVSGKSKVKLDTSAAGAYGSTVSNYSVTIDGVALTGASATSATLQNQTSVIRSVSYTVTVTDSRGRKSDAFSGSIALYPYTAPSLSGVSVVRSDAAGTPKDDGTYFLPTWSTQVYSALPRGQSVQITGAVQGVARAGWVNVGNVQNGVPFGGSYSSNTTFSAMLTITDSLGSSSSYIVTVPSATWVMKFRPDGNGVAFGKAAEADGVFEIDWKLRLNNGVEGIGASDVGALPETTTALPNPHKLTINGTEYDGSEDKTVTMSGMGMDLLWENKSPTSSMAAKTVNLDVTGDYPLYLVLARYSASDSTWVSCIAPSGQTGRIQLVGSTYQGNRMFTINGTTAVFGAGTYNNTSVSNSKTDNNYGIPVYIYGIRL